jgi:hypothetical protein
MGALPVLLLGLFCWLGTGQVSPPVASDKDLRKGENPFLNGELLQIEDAVL